MQPGNESSGWHSLTLHRIAEVPCCIGHIVAELERLGYTDRDLFAVRLALEEALVNAVKHGHRHDASKTARVRFQATPEQLIVEIEDEGPGFDPDGVPDPLAPENLERPGGRGIFLMRHYMSWVSFNERGNGVTMCRRRSG
jgi:serine/threonine-protein kinase RsbW